MSENGHPLVREFIGLTRNKNDVDVDALTDLAARATAAAAIAEQERDKLKADAERTDWLEWLGLRQGVSIVNDNMGRWAVVGSDVQDGVTADAVAITVFVESQTWRGSLREALDAAIDSTQLAATRARADERRPTEHPQQ